MHSVTLINNFIVVLKWSYDHVTIDVTGTFLKMIAEMVRAKSILEIGMYTGYSAINLASTAYCVRIKIFGSLTLKYSIYFRYIHFIFSHSGRAGHTGRGTIL